MPKITPFLWFDDQAEEAATLYTSLFKNSSITHISRQGEAGKATIVNFTLDGQDFIALNGGPHYKFTEAVSMFIECTGQDEVDRLWEALSQGGEVQQCGWLKDRFGLSWQIIPKQLIELMSDPDPEKAARVREAMLKMVKINVQALEKAHEAE